MTDPGSVIGGCEVGQFEYHDRVYDRRKYPRFNGALDNALHNGVHTLASTHIPFTPRRTHHLRAIQRNDTLTTEGPERELEEQ